VNSEWVIWLFEGIAVAAAILILFSKSVFHAALNLLVVIICLGVLFGLYGSEFLLITQIMVYGGGVLVLILFATMVTSRGPSTATEIPGTISIPMLLASAGVVTILTTYASYAQPRGVPYTVTTQQLGVNMMLQYALPLEISGILLLVSLIGATIVSIQKPAQG
jgi:NADH:ubiquinone oxidoreductase subunit 6 (subunit J)